jgi:hypothetical protein
MALDIYHRDAIHRAMLADTVRNRAFDRALRRSVGPADVVLDVGAGTGVLSMMAARAGARRVYAIELSPAAAALARANTASWGGRIQVLQGDVAEVDVPEPVDVVVSEWLGAFGIDENLVAMALVARDRWLRPGGRLLPARVTALAAPVEQVHTLTRPVSVAATPGGTVLRWSDRGLPAEALLGPAQAMWCTDLATLTVQQARLPFRAALRWKATRPAVLEGLVAWFDCGFGEGSHLSNAPGQPATHWGQFVFALRAPVAVHAGQDIAAEITVIPAAPGYCHHAWSVRVEGGVWQHHDTRGG